MSNSLCTYESIALLAALAWPQAAATPQKPAFEPFVEFKAGPGTRFSVLEVKSAPHESLFAFVPTGLLDDDAGQTQLAHLLEHMLIRSTEKEEQNEMRDGGITFNGETNEVALRLEVFAPPKLAGEALDKLLGWLQATEFEADVLAIEKKKIGVELDTTCASGFTHKWALAAWNQVARRGRDHAAVRGDVMTATAEQVESADDERVDLAKVRIVAVGPVPVAALKTLAQQALAKQQGLGALSDALAGATAKRHEAEAAKRAKNVKPLATGDHVATWDLPNSHLLAWYLLPNAKAGDATGESADDAAAALALSQLLSMRLQADPKLTAEKVVAIASADAVVPEGRVLMLSASLPMGLAAPDGAGAATVLAEFDAAIAQLFDRTPQLGTVENYLKQAAAEFGGLPDFPALRRQFVNKAVADQLEAQVALNFSLREQSSNHSWGELGAAFARLTKAKLEALAKERLAPAQRSTLLLTPKG